jgi:aminoglycoside 3-N-acetyltransferase
MEDDLTYRELVDDLQALGLTPDLRANVIAHASLEAIGQVQGGAPSVVGAILACAETLVMPAFTFQTMVVPEYGPPNNGIEYGGAIERNAQAEFFRPDLPVHPNLGPVPEALRADNDTLRSIHPVLSFVAQGRHAHEVLAAQSVDNPFGPVEWLAANNGYVLLLGKNHKANFALHLAEQRAGRQGFVRWALTLDDIEELPNFPGCSDGFESAADYLTDMTRQREIGFATAQLIRLPDMLARIEALVAYHPYALLCHRATCARCRAREPR